MARLTLRFAQSARCRLIEILEFIAQDNPSAARNLAKNVEQGLDRLLVFPDSGRRIPEAPELLERDLVIPPCIRIFYRVEGQVLRVLHVMRVEQDFHPGALDQ